MNWQRMKITKALCSLALICLLMFTVATAVSNAATITFDENTPTNDSSKPVTTLYSALGVTFGGDNAGTWGGMSKGDPGTWGLEGTNGSAFLGNNGQNSYDTSIVFSTPLSSVSFDVSRSNGSAAGQSLTWYAYDGVNLLGYATITLGGINSWSTVTLHFAGMDKIVLDGSSEGFSPYGIDNLQFSAAAAVPEPLTLWLLGAGLIGLAGLSRRQPE